MRSGGSAYRSHRRSLFLVALSLAALLGASCSGNDPEEASSFASGYRSVAQVYEAGIEDVKARSEATSEGGLERVIASYESILQATEGAREGWAELEPPDEIAADFDSMLELLDRQIEALDALVSSARERDTVAVSQAANELTELTQTWNEKRVDIERRITGG